MSTILITGINGFLGGSIARRLYGKHSIVGISRRRDTSKTSKFNFEIFLNDEASVNELFQKHKIDVIIHTATDYGRHIDFIKTLNSNFVFPFFLLNKAIEYNVQLFINSDTILEKFVSPYSLSKNNFKDWLEFRSSEIKVVNMELEHFYGPGASQTNFISYMIDKLSKNETSIPLTYGEQLRDFVFYNDVVDAYELVVDKLENDQFRFKAFQVASGELTTIRDLIVSLKRLLNSTSELDFGAIPYRNNELMKSTSNNAELVSLGWIPKTSILAGLEQTVKYYSI